MNTLLISLLIVINIMISINCKSILVNETVSIANPRLWHPSNGVTREEWLRCHGVDCDQWTRVKRKLAQLKTIAAKSFPEYDVTVSDGERQTNATSYDPDDAVYSPKQDERLDTCIWFTEAQIDYILNAELTDAYHGYSRPKKSTRTRRKAKRVKRKIQTQAEQAFKSWGRQIRYKFDGDHSPQEQQWIRNGFQSWMDQTCLTFVEEDMATQISEPHVLVTRNDQGCFSYIGKTGMVPQQMNIGWNCMQRFGVVVHEIGHTLGLWHEHQRDDRDDYIIVKYENIGSYQYQFIKQPTDNRIPYDIGSVMHYASNDASKNNLDTLTALDPLFQSKMGQRLGLSFLDSKVINLVYCKAECKQDTPQPCQREGYQNPKNCAVCICSPGFTGDYCERIEDGKHVQCGGVVNLSGKATIESPGFRTTKSYESHVECSWLVKAPVGKKITLQFKDEFAMYIGGRSLSTCQHWLEVQYDGHLGVPGPRFCGYTRPNDILTSKDNEMLLLFRANQSVGWVNTRRGFSVELSLTDDPNHTTTKPECVMLDLTFALDISRHVNAANFKLSKDFVKLVIDRLTNSMGGACIRYALLTFAEKPRTHFSFDTDRGLISSTIDLLPISNGESDIYSGLKHARDELFANKSFSRPSAHKHIVLITDNMSPDKASVNISSSLMLSGVVIHPVGVGVANYKFDSLADSYDNVYYSDTWSDIAEHEEELAIGILDAVSRASIIATSTTAASTPTTSTPTTSTPTTRSTTSSWSTTRPTHVPTTHPTTTTASRTTTGVNPNQSQSWSCSFESDGGSNTDHAATQLCGMLQERSTDDFDWTLWSGPTPSNPTGPSRGFGGTGFYIYIEASSTGSQPRYAGDKARISLPSVLSAGDYCLDFRYHMFGFHIGSLQVYKTGHGGNENVLSLQGAVDQYWHRKRMRVHLSAGQTITFEAVRAKAYSGDIAIDQISIVQGNC